MSNKKRDRTKRFAVMAGSVALVAGGALALPMASLAGAAAPQIGVILTPGGGGGTALTSGATITDQTPVEVQVPANSTLLGGSTTSVKIYECGDADGQTDDLPTDASGCDGTTVSTGGTININQTDGSVDKKNYTIKLLPTATESAGSLPICNATSACVLYIGQNINDFTQPLVWSTPFFVGASAGTSTPESPATIALPVVGAIVLAGGVALTIRRRRRNAAAA